MRVSATELMKKLKYLESEIREVRKNDDQESYVPVEKEEDKVEYTPVYESTYNFAENRNKIAELYQEEIKIKKALNEFNQNTTVIGYSFNINEALIRLGQLKSEVTALTNLSRFGLFKRDGYGEGLRKATFNFNEVKDYLRKAQRELSQLQVAIDKTNLFSEIEYED